MKKKMIRRLSLIMALCLVLTACGSTQEDPQKTTGSAGQTQSSSTTPEAPPVTGKESKVLVNAVLPDSARAESDEGKGFSDGLVNGGAAKLLLDGNDENHVYSPLNIMLALSMLAEITDGESRAELLSLCGVKSIEELRSTVGEVLKKAYYDDKDMISLPGASLWLRNDFDGYNMETLETLAKQFAASSFSGSMGSDEYDKLLQKWLNEQTKGLLKEQAEGVKLDPSTIIALATTLYYKVSWMQPFYEGGTEDGVFHSPGGDVTVPFMKTDVHEYYRGEHFGAVHIYMADGNKFWLFLPDEGYGTEDILNDDTYMALIRGEVEEAAEYGKVYLSLPKLDITDELDLVDTLKQLGVTKVFDEKVSDFSPLYSGEGPDTKVSKIKHAARLTADEYGVEAAAFTVVMVEGASAMLEPMYFTCDRPFLFTVADDSGLVWFSGVVNNPQG